MCDKKMELEKKSALLIEEERLSHLHTSDFKHEIVEYHTKLLTPQKSAAIEAELRAGPPSEWSKAEKKAWRAKMTLLHEAAKKREDFFKSSDSMMNAAMSAISSTPDAPEEEEQTSEASKARMSASQIS